MKQEPQLFICSLDHRRPQDTLGNFWDENGQSVPIHTEVFGLVKYYLSELDRMAQLLQGQGIASVRDSNILREWRRIDEVVRPLVFNKIAQLPHDQHKIWYTLIYRRKLQMCFVISPVVAIYQERATNLEILKASVRRRSGRILSVVGRDPREPAVRQVLRLARPEHRFSVVSPSRGPSLKGLTVVGYDHYLAGHPIVQQSLLG